MDQERRRATNTKKLVAGATVLGVSIGIPIALTGTAQAATMSQWEKVAQCESGNVWDINYSSDGMSVGGLQFQNASWQDALAFLDSKGYNTTSWTHNLYQGMPKSAVPTKDQTILAGEALLHEQGPSAWVCDTTQGGVLSASMFDGGPNPWGLSGTNVPASLGGSATTTPSTPTTTSPVNTGTTTTNTQPKAITTALAFAVSQLGKPYAWGGVGPNSYDCSGLAYTAYRKAGVDIPRDTYGEWAGLTHVSMKDLRPGDLIEWNFPGAGASPNHVSISMGGDKMIESSGSNDGVVITSLATRQKSGTVVGVVRPVAWPAGSSVPTTPVTTTPPKKPAPKPVHKTTPVSTHKPSVKKVVRTHKGDVSYTVVKDDWLSKLALRYYGDAEKWPTIYAANQAVIGDNPDLIFPGQKYIIPNANIKITVTKSRTAAPVKTTPAPAPTTSDPAPTTTAPSTSTNVVDGWSNPLANMVVSQAYGNPDSGYGLGYHTGVDLSTGGKTGVAAKAIADSTVVFAGQGGNPGAGAAYGNHIILQLPDGKFALYAHLASFSVQAGSKVSAGQMIGIVGATGNATGVHLHFEIRNNATQYYDGNFQDPMAYLHSHGL